jgi:transposase InsO family protein
MIAPRYNHRTIPPEHRDTSQWPSIDTSALDADARARYERLRAALTLYLDTGALGAAAREAGCSNALLLKQLNRCLTIAHDHAIYGWRALVPFLRLSGYHRRAPQASTSRPYGGKSGMFTQFLEAYPEIREALDSLILKRSASSRTHEARVSITALARELKRLCQRQGMLSTAYPLSTRSLARKSLATYVNTLIQEYPALGVPARYGRQAGRRLALGTGHTRDIVATQPYDILALDAHKFDCIGTLALSTPAGPQLVAVERLWIVVVFDVFTRAVLGYSIGICKEISAATIEEALLSAISLWSPRKLSLGFVSYHPDAALPSAVFPELCGVFGAVLTVDNAAVHLARRISEKARRRLGCAIAYAPVGSWEHNDVLERFFGTLERFGFQRLPSTMGANVVDTRRDRPTQTALRNHIELHELVDLADVFITYYNAKPHGALGGRTPLETLRDHLDTRSAFLARPLPPPTGDYPELGVTVETVTVRGDVTKGRRPYVQLDRVRYTSPALANDFSAIGQRLRLHIHEANIRTVQAYYKSGLPIGTLFAQGPWSRVDHSRETRKAIMRCVDDGQLRLTEYDDPCRVYLDFLADKTRADRNKRPKNISRNATKLAKLLSEEKPGMPAMAATAPPIPAPVATPSDPPGQTPPRLPLPATLPRPKWRSYG